MLFQYRNQSNKTREEMFNLRSNKCQEEFKKATENYSDLVNCFKNGLPFEKQTRKWQNCSTQSSKNTLKK